MAEQPQTPVKSPSTRFIFPQMQDNPHGWGPLEVPEQFKDTPYQPFSKDDRLGKVWTIMHVHLRMIHYFWVTKIIITLYGNDHRFALCWQFTYTVLDILRLIINSLYLYVGGIW